MEVLRHDFFRVTRDADVTVSDEAYDLLRAVEDELRRRRFGEVVRLEVSSSMDPEMCGYLVEQLAINEMQVIDIHGLLAAEDLWDVYGVEGHRDLRDESWTPVPQTEFNHTQEESRADSPHPVDRSTCSPRSVPATSSSTTPTAHSPEASGSPAGNARWRRRPSA